MARKYKCDRDHIKSRKIAVEWPLQAFGWFSFSIAITAAYIKNADRCCPPGLNEVKGFLVAVPQIAHNSTAHTLQPLKPQTVLARLTLARVLRSAFG
jgi:hypothetical protein